MRSLTSNLVTELRPRIFVAPHATVWPTVLLAREDTDLRGGMVVISISFVWRGSRRTCDRTTPRGILFPLSDAVRGGWRFAKR